MSSTLKRGRKKANEGSTAPQKKFFRQRAHCNPLSHNDTFEYPIRPDCIDWTRHYPKFTREDGRWLTQPVEIADVGCGYGGLIVDLSEVFPDKLMLGMEIRMKVTEFVRLRILAARNDSGTKENISVLRTNTMRYLPTYFHKAQLSKIFFCFPDPHFKARNHRRRIVTPALLAEYAYVLQKGGRLYHITDVEELHGWMKGHCEAHPAFRLLSDEEMEADPAVAVMRVSTEEGQKVARNEGSKWWAVFERVEDESVETMTSDEFWGATQPASGACEVPPKAGEGAGNGSEKA